MAVSSLSTLGWGCFFDQFWVERSGEENVSLDSASSPSVFRHLPPCLSQVAPSPICMP